MYEASNNSFQGVQHTLVPVSFVPGTAPLSPQPPGLTYLDSIDISQKILLPLWHPKRPLLALAAVNNLYIFRR